MVAAAVPLSDHLAAATPEVLALFTRFRELVDDCGPTTLRVTKTSITFKGTRRGFCGATPHGAVLRGYLDLQTTARHPTIHHVSPYTQRLFVHHFRAHHLDELDDAFAALVADAYAVGAGAHVRG